LSAEHHPALAHHFDNLGQQREAETLAMWAFLVTEILLFGGLFFAYTLYRLRYPGAFAAGSGHLNWLLGAFNTGVLLGSSLTMALAVRAAQLGQRKPTTAYLGATLGLGTVFLVIKAFEWTHDWHVGLVPGLHFTYAGWQSAEQGRLAELFFSLYFTMTGLHAIHMIVGMAVIVWLMRRAWENAYSPEYHSPVELTGLYWHFVDVVWIFLFPLFYLLGSSH
jgi:cytochrome c oxidase subunit 3